MSYQKTVWVNNETPLNQENMNKIEQALDELFSGLGLSNTSLGDLGNLLDETISRVLEEEQKSSVFDHRLDLLDLEDGRVFQIEVKNITQDQRLDSAEGRIDVAEGAISGANSKNTEQDGRLDSAESRLTGVENVNLTQDTAIQNLNTDKVDKVTGKQLSEENFTALLKQKLEGVATGAQVNIIEHIKVDGVDLVVSAKTVNIDLSGKLDVTLKGQANGLAELDSSGFVPMSQLPGRVAEVHGYDSMTSFPDPGEENKIYKARDTGRIYRWDGEGYTEISASLALGITSATAFRGDHGKVAYDHTFLKDNPHDVTAEQLNVYTKDAVYTQEQIDLMIYNLTRTNVLLKTLLHIKDTETIDGGDFDDPVTKLLDGGMFTDTQFTTVDGGEFIEAQLIIDGGGF